jgi:riboflavin kinase/FMN adenylyltransferase
VQLQNQTDWLPGVANFGRRPTVNDRGALFEVNLFDLDKDLYGQQLAIRVIDFIRPEMKFSGIDDLKTQISLDAMRAKELLSEIRS